MGTLNHSEKCVASFLSSVDAEVVARMKKIYATTNPAKQAPPFLCPHSGQGHAAITNGAVNWGYHHGRRGVGLHVY